MKLRLVAATLMSLLLFVACKKSSTGKDDDGNNNGQSTKQAYVPDLTASYTNGTATVIRVQKDGKLLVLGFDWFVRLEKDGVTVDNSFKPVSEIVSSGLVRSFVIQNDGKILVFGNFKLASGRKWIVA